MNVYRIALNDQQYNVIMTALREHPMPWAVANKVILSISSQVKEQAEAALKRAERNKPESKEAPEKENPSDEEQAKNAA